MPSGKDRLGDDNFINYLKSYSTQLSEANCNCVYEAEYQGREVKLGKPTQGDVKKFKVQPIRATHYLQPK